MRPYKLPKQLQPLTDQQLDQVNDWLDNMKYDEVCQKLRDEFQIEISVPTLCRYQQNHHLARELFDRGEDAGQIRDLLALLNGQPVPYDQTGIELIMKRAFDLACARKVTPSHLATLLRVFHYKKNCEWNERRLAQNDKRIDISERLAKLKESSASNNSAPSTLHSPLEDALGPLATSLDDIEKRAIAKFGDNLVTAPPSFVPSSSPLSQASSEILSNPADSPASPDSSSRREETLEKEQLVVQTLPTNPGNEPQPLNNEQENNSTDPISVHSCPLAVSSSSQCQMENAQCSMLNETNLRQPSSLLSLHDRPSLHDRVSQYTLERHNEALHGLDRNKVGKWHARTFKSKMQWCPCGNHLPCPEHGDFPDLFWRIHPDNADYTDILRSKNLPFTPPHLFIAEQAKRAALEKWSSLLKDNSQLSTLHSQLKSHAIRRWRAYTPRPPGSPAPDESWNEECPCGAKLPCEHHGDLWREVRYIKPSDPDYAAALKRNGIPIYTPKPEDLQPPSHSSNNPTIHLHPSAVTA